MGWLGPGVCWLVMSTWNFLIAYRVRKEKDTSSLESRGAVRRDLRLGWERRIDTDAGKSSFFQRVKQILSRTAGLINLLLLL